MRKLSEEAFVTMGVCPNMSYFSKKAFKSTALLKNCSNIISLPNTYKTDLSTVQ